MKLKPLIAALALGVTGVAANAADTDWGSHDLLESALVLTSGGLFNDTFTFELGAASTVSSSISSVGSIMPGVYSIFGAGDDGVVGTADDVNTTYAWSFGGAPTVNTATLAAGTYYYAVFGVASGAAAYSLNSAAAVTPVPEPETYALLLGGLGVVGFVARRRRTD